MDIFDQYLYDEITKIYSKEKLSSEDYEELYQRFENLEHLAEVKPYLFAMRYMGYGVPAEKENVMSEMKTLLNNGDIHINGLYYDLLLFEKENDYEVLQNLKEMASKGYSDVYLKEKSHLHASSHEPTHSEKRDHAPTPSKEPQKVVFKRMIFEGCGYSGLYFTSGDIDYLNAKVFIEPVNETRHLRVRSQIYAGDEPFSKVFSDEYTLKPGDKWFTTTGWGNKNFYAYDNRVYQWRIEFDGEDVYCQDFRFYGGKIDKSGIPLTDLKLFASKASGAAESDRSNYKTTFDAATLEYIYFRLFFNSPGEEKVLQIFLKIKCLEDDSVFCDKYIIHRLNADTISCWEGVGYSKSGKWKKGLYQYCLSFERGSKYEGTFTIY